MYVMLAMFLEKGNNLERGSKNRPVLRNPAGYRTTPITIRERNLTSTFKKLFLFKAPGTNKPFKIALEVLRLYILSYL